MNNDSPKETVIIDGVPQTPTDLTPEQTTPVEQQPAPGAAPAPAQQTVPPANEEPRLTPAQFAQIQATMQQQQAAAVAPVNPVDAMTAEQKLEHFKTFVPDENFATGFVNALQPDDEGKIDAAKLLPVLEQLRDGLVNQSLRGAELMMEQLGQRFDQSIQPMQGFYQKQVAEQAWAQFTGSYPAMQHYRPLVESVAQQLSTNPVFQQMPPEQKLASINQQVEMMVKQTNPQFQSVLKQPNSPGSPNTPGTVAMAGSVPPITTAPPAAQQQQSNPFYADDVFGS